MSHSQAQAWPRWPQASSHTGSAGGEIRAAAISSRGEESLVTLEGPGASDRFPPCDLHPPVCRNKCPRASHSVCTLSYSIPSLARPICQRNTGAPGLSRSLTQHLWNLPSLSGVDTPTPVTVKAAGPFKPGSALPPPLPYHPAPAVQ